MRPIAIHLLSILLAGAAASMTSGCGDADPNGSAPGKGAKKEDGKGSSAAASKDDEDSTTDGSMTGEMIDRMPTEPGVTPPGPDGDGDGFTDDVDCDPASKDVAGTKLLDDDLATDKGLFTPADAFAAASWSFDNTAYRQIRLGDASDVTFFNKDAAVGDVVAEVRAASTELSNTFSPMLRQMFLLVGATVTGGQLSAIGCGIEVVEGLSPTQKTSIVRLSGAPGNVTTTVLQRVNRAVVQVNEEFGIKARLSGGTLTCDVVQAAITTATASNLGTVTGSVGFFTRQTKALFKNARVCKLK